MNLGGVAEHAAKVLNNKPYGMYMPPFTWSVSPVT
jgi:hypothetical protein